jgi:hypothetical protein
MFASPAPGAPPSMFSSPAPGVPSNDSFHTPLKAEGAPAVPPSTGDQVKALFATPQQVNSPDGADDEDGGIDD